MKGFITCVTCTTCKKLWSKSGIAMSIYLLMAFLFSANAFSQTQRSQLKPEGPSLVGITASTLNFSVDFSQGANKDNPFPLGTLHWIGSILQSSNSRYAEGMSTMQRVIFTDLTGGVSDGAGGTVHKLR